MGDPRRRGRTELQAAVGVGRPRLARTASGLLVALSPLSGAAGGGMQAVSTPMPAARAGLLPEYRIFYDALKDYGEWTLIEPYGYVFRPNVSFIGWSPYQY